MALVVRYSGHQNCIGVLDDRIVVFTRREKLTKECLDVIERESEAIARRSLRPIGFFALIPASAGLSDAPTLERQRQLLKHILIDAQTHFAYVVTGEGVHATTIRATVRVGMLGRRTMKLSDSVLDAAQWFGARLSLAPDVLVGAVEELERSLSSPTA